MPPPRPTQPLPWGALLVLVVIVAALGIPTPEERVLSPLLMSPAAGHERDSLRFGFVADAQQEGERGRLRGSLDALRRLGAHVLLYGGDTSYGYGGPPADWVEAMEPFQGQTLLVYGNHDRSGTYRDYHPQGPEGTTWWAWRPEARGLVVVGLDTNAPLRPSSEQTAWLERTLAAHANDTVVLLLHMPWWVPQGERNTWIDADGEHLDRLVDAHRVDVVLAAHTHYYARMERNATTFIINGPAEAHTRSVPPAVALASDHSASIETWMMLDVLPCGIAGWTYDARSHAQVDSFARGTASLRVAGETAWCEEPPPAQEPPAIPAPAGDESPTPSTQVREEPAPGTPLAQPATPAPASEEALTPSTQVLDVPGPGAAWTTGAIVVAVLMATRRKQIPSDHGR